MLSRQARSAKSAASVRKQQSDSKDKRKGRNGYVAEGRFSKSIPMTSTRNVVTKNIRYVYSILSV